MTEEREMTAPMTSVGAEVGQSPNVTTEIISDYGENFNPSAEEMFEAQMQYEQEMQAQAQIERESAPDFMQTVSMPELYEMVYPGKPPIIDHFLYPGTYLFVGAPKVGKSFMMAQIAYHVSSGTPMWDYAVRKGFQPCDNIIVLRIAVSVALGFTNFLQRVNDDERGFGVFIHERTELIEQTFVQRLGSN